MRTFKTLGFVLALVGLLGAIAPEASAKANGNGKANNGNQTSQPPATTINPPATTAPPAITTTPPATNQPTVSLACASGSVTSNPLAGGSFLSHADCLRVSSANDFSNSLDAALTTYLDKSFENPEGWVSGGKYDSGKLSFLPDSAGVESQDFGFSWVQTSKGVGTWSVNQAITTPFVISLKAGNAYTAYYVDGNAGTLGGNWATFDGKDLSHASIFVAKGGLTPEEPNATVPEPTSTAALALVGLSAIGLTRKKRA